MNHEVIISCAVTGDDTKVTKSPHCAITPAQIAASCVAAAQAGAAIVHIHVRDPDSGAFSMETRHYREVVKRVRDSKVDVIVNLTCGMGGYIVVGDRGLADTPGPGSDFVSQEDRMRHVIDLCAEGSYKPEIATLDCGSLNFGDGNRAYLSTPNYLRKGAAILKDLNVKPELEIFDTGNLWFVKQLVKEGLLEAPSLIQLCMGIAYGVPADVGHLLAMVNALPADCNWGSFAISRMQMPWVAQSVLLGGNVRVGLEDNLYLSKGVYASNAQLVQKARTIIEAMGARVLTPAEARERLKLH
ncbi:MAG TPA: 3-keto-5-aminohexanoate cleavage protein [Steroidobacteraceae bacterium]|nr:3-keto-5-aminohexanoate cleavage protein [Steroidobacteraceae bacterium]